MTHVWKNINIHVLYKCIQVVLVRLNPSEPDVPEESSQSKPGRPLALNIIIIPY